MRLVLAGLARLLLAAASLAGAGAFAADASDYRDAGTVRGVVRDAEWTDSGRGRTVPVRLRLPDGPGPHPVILFSHGLGGSRAGGETWGQHWASHGYLVVHLQHPGSDEDLWKGRAAEPAAARSALLGGANARQLLARVQDAKFVLDEIARRAADGDADLARADLARVGMSGHSFGAQTTLALAGQRFVAAGGAEPLLLEPRFKAAVAFSPNARGRAGDPRGQFGSIRVPALSITGTRDGDVIGDGTTPASRTVPFENMPPPGKVLAVFDGGDHMVFGGHDLRREPRPRDREIQACVKALTLAFWDAHLRADARALAWLEQGGARAMLAGKDRYETKP